MHKTSLLDIGLEMTQNPFPADSLRQLAVQLDLHGLQIIEVENRCLLSTLMILCLKVVVQRHLSCLAPTVQLLIESRFQPYVQKTPLALRSTSKRPVHDRWTGAPSV
jgi:hypothetical protein